MWVFLQCWDFYAIDNYCMCKENKQLVHRNPHFKSIFVPRCCSVSLMSGHLKCLIPLSSPVGRKSRHLK